MGVKTKAESSSTRSDRYADRPGGESIGRDALGLPDNPGSFQVQNAPIVLVLLGTYLPGYKAGGPIRSIENLVAAFGSEFHFRVATQDRDLGDKLPFPGIVVNRWVPVGSADVMYLRPGLRGFLDMGTLLRSVDRNTVLYLNSFYARRFSMLAALMCSLKLCGPRCLVLAPRGEFSLGALRLKRMRKLLYVKISRWLGLYQSVIWHASSDFEAEDIRRQFPITKYINIAGVISDLESRRTRRTSVVVTALDIAGATSLGPDDRPAKTPGQLRVVFVSRVSRKKNLANALRMLEGLSGDVSFDIYGPAEDAGYWGECQGLIAALPPNVQVRYQGEIEHERVGQVFAEHDLFLFPTLGENYGHVICEALASGCPVLISDQTPWRNLEAEGVGWDIPLGEMERFRSVLQQCVDGDGEWFAALSKRAMNYAVKRASDPKTIEANRELFQGAFAWPSHGDAP
jgi:glycosyltransferase involved in cell wall biosynthesis